MSDIFDEVSNGDIFDQIEPQKPDVLGTIAKTALTTATDPLLAPFGMDSRTRQAQEVYGRGREGILQSSPFQAMRAGASKEPFKGLVSVADRISPKAGEYARKITPNEIVKQGQGLGVDVGLGLGTDAVMSKAPAVAGRMTRSLGNAAEEVGGRALNFYIKPRQNAYQFGKKPGKAVIRNIGPKMSRQSLLDAIKLKTDELTRRMEGEVAGSQKLVDIGPIKEHFKNILTRMSDFPETYSGQVEAHRGFARDLDALISKHGYTEANGSVMVTPETALKIKRALGEIPSWNITDPKLGAIGKTARETYGRFDRGIDAAAPQAKQLNEDISGLIGARQGIEKGMMREQGKYSVGPMELAAGALLGHGNPLSPGFLAGAGVMKAIRSAPFNTSVGAVAGGIGKASRSVAPILESLEKPALIEQIFQSMKRPKTKALTISR